MAYVPRGLVSQDQLTSSVDEAIGKLGRKVIRVRYNIGVDSSDDAAIFFRIVLPDASTREESLVRVTAEISAILLEEIHPYENWGLIPYFSFRSKTEQALRNDPEWA
jgi:hypothetical protein